MNPIELSKKISELSEAYYQSSMEMGDIAARSGTAWLELRKGCKTDKECDRKWEVTADGKMESYLKWYLKGLEKSISAKKMELRILTGSGA